MHGIFSGTGVQTKVVIFKGAMDSESHFMCSICNFFANKHDPSRFYFLELIYTYGGSSMKVINLVKRLVSSAIVT